MLSLVYVLYAESGFGFFRIVALILARSWCILCLVYRLCTFLHLDSLTAVSSCCMTTRAVSSCCMATRAVCSCCMTTRAVCSCCMATSLLLSVDDAHGHKFTPLC